MFLYFILITLALSMAPDGAKAQSQNSPGVQVAIAVDLAGEFALDDSTEASDKFEPRAVDIIFTSPVDHIFNGTLSLVAHQEDGEAVFELHEAFVTSDKLLPGLSLKLGQFFLGIGRLSQRHQHEWPFISAPKVQQEFFAGEGIIDTGLEVSYLLPLPFYLDISIGATNGYAFGHGHSDHEEEEEAEDHEGDQKPRKPTRYLRLKSFASMGTYDVQPGFNILARTDHEGERTLLTGIDITLKRKTDKYLDLLVQTEFWQRKIKPKEGREETEVGGYFYPEVGLGEGLALGVRLDYYSESKDDVDQSLEALVPTLSFSPSEFSKLRMAYRYERNKIEGEADTLKRVVELGVTYIIGAHPAHDF